MWYVGRVVSGKERYAQEACLRLIPKSLLKECIIPEYETMWKVCGEWRLIKRLLFTSYIFLVTDNIDELAKQLRTLPVQVHVLGNDEGYSALPEKEINWLCAFMDNEHVVRMSEGFIVGDKITITRGPLRGFEGDIKKINRRKKRALVDVSLFGRNTLVNLGLEIVSKQP